MISPRTASAILVCGVVLRSTQAMPQERGLEGLQVGLAPAAVQDVLGLDATSTELAGASATNGTVLITHPSVVSLRFCDGTLAGWTAPVSTNLQDFLTRWQAMALARGLPHPHLERTSDDAELTYVQWGDANGGTTTLVWSATAEGGLGSLVVETECPRPAPSGLALDAEGQPIPAGGPDAGMQAGAEPDEAGHQPSAGALAAASPPPISFPPVTPLDDVPPRVDRTGPVPPPPAGPTIREPASSRSGADEQGRLSTAAPRTVPTVEGPAKGRQASSPTARTRKEPASSQADGIRKARRLPGSDPRELPSPRVARGAPGDWPTRADPCGGNEPATGTPDCRSLPRPSSSGGFPKNLLGSIFEASGPPRIVDDD